MEKEEKIQVVSGLLAEVGNALLIPAIVASVVVSGIIVGTIVGPAGPTPDDQAWGQRGARAPAPAPANVVAEPANNNAAPADTDVELQRQ